MRLTQAELAAARALELRQPVLRSRLAALLDSFITSGLYDDESSGDFAAFVAHVQKELSISPRTILLQQLNAKLTHLVDTRADASELHVLLGLPRGAPIARLADALEALGAGRAHARWSAAAAAGRKTSALAEPQLRAKIVGGLRAKAAARGEAALSEESVAATLDRLEAEEEARLEAWKARYLTPVADYFGFRKYATRLAASRALFREDGCGWRACACACVLYTYLFVCIDEYIKRKPAHIRPADVPFQTALHTRNVCPDGFIFTYTSTHTPSLSSRSRLHSTRAIPASLW